MMNITKLINLSGIIKLATVLYNHKYGLLIITALTIIVNRNFLFGTGFPAGVDYLSWPATLAPLSQDGNMFYVWELNSFGQIYNFGLRLPLAIIDSVINNPLLTVKLCAVFIFFLAGIAMYSFTYHYTKSKLASIFSAILFIMTQWYLSQSVNYALQKMFSYAILPFVLLFFDKALRDNKFRWMALFSILFTALILMKVRPAAMTGFFVALYALFVIIFPYSELTRKQIITRVLKVCSIEAVLVLSFSAVVLVSYFLISSGPYGSGATLALSPLRSTDLFRAIAGFSREVSYMGFVWGIWFSNHPYLPIPVYYLLMALPALLAFPAIIVRRDRLTLFLAFAALLSAFIAKGTNPPLGDLFSWAYYNLPFGGIFYVPNRWLMLTLFCYAFLAGITINFIYTKVRSYIKPGGFKQRWANRALRPLSLGIVILLIFLLVLPMGKAVTEGLMTHELPEDAIKAHQWIGEQPGDFRVATVPFQLAMDTGWWEEQGWSELDIGRASQMFHANNPVIGETAWDFTTTDFITYIHGVIEKGETSKLMEILGTFNVRYLVVHSYLPEVIPFGKTPEFHHIFFNQQEGLTPVFSSGEVVVYENDYWTPLIFPAPKSAVVVGGREALTTLAELEGDEFSSWNLVFVDQLIKDRGKDAFLEILKESESTIFVNSQPEDLAMLLLDDVIRIPAVEFAFVTAFPGTDSPNHWINLNEVTKDGLFTLNNSTLFTSGNNQVNVPLDIEEKGEYQVWFRIVYGVNRGELSASLDGELLSSVTPQASQTWGLKWVKMGSVDLEEGEHNLVIQNTISAGSNNDVDEIVLVQNRPMETTTREVLDILEQSQSRLLFLSSAEKIYRQLPQTSSGYEEEIIRSDNQTSFWNNFNPDNIEISDDPGETATEDSKDSLKIDIISPREYFTLVSRNLELVDWSDTEYFDFWFKGTGSGAPFSLGVYFNRTSDNLVSFVFNDSSEEWRHLTFSTKEPARTLGEADCTNVSRMTISSDIKDTTGVFYLDRLSKIYGVTRELTYDLPQTGDYGIAVQAEIGPNYGGLDIQTEQQQILLDFNTIQEVNPTSIVSDNQTAFWTNINPDYVSLSEVPEVPKGVDSQNSLVLGLDYPGRDFFSLIAKEYSSLEDWSRDERLVLWFKGHGSGTIFDFNVYFDNSWENRAGWYWRDSSTEWKKLEFSLSEPDVVAGENDWSKVWVIRMSTNKDLTGTFYFNDLFRSEGTEGERGVSWFTPDSLNLATGESTLSLYPEGTVEMKQVALYKLDDSSQLVPIEDLFRVNDGKYSSVTYEKINPTKYLVHVETTKPFWLIFSDSHHPLWKAFLDDKEIVTTQSYSFINSFFLTKTGQYDVIVEFTGQRFVNWGWLITVTSIFLSLIFVVLEWRGYPPFRRKK